MNSQNKNPVIDADAHVVECAHTWDFMDKSEEKYRPISLEAREEAGVRQQFWLVDGKVRGFRFAVLSDELMAKRQQQVGRKFAEQQESRELANVDLRLEHMDQTAVDIQVLHNTMFIESCTDRQCRTVIASLGDDFDDVVSVLVPMGREIRAMRGYPASGPHEMSHSRLGQIKPWHAVSE